MSFSYNDFYKQVALMAAIPVDDKNFADAMPFAIAYAEDRIQRDLDLLMTVDNYTDKLTALSSKYSFPTSAFVTVQEVNILTPTTASGGPDNYTRNPCRPITKEVMRWMYPNSSSAGVPQYFAMYDQNTVLLGPWPDNTYKIEIVGTTREDPLSDSNIKTQILTYFPDMMVVAAMIYISGYQRNFGKVSDDPTMAMTYEAQYQALKASAMIEEARKKFQAAVWTSMSPSPVATPTR